MATRSYRWQPPKEEKRLPIDPKILEIVKSGMAGVVAEPGGTGHRLSLLPVTIGGKTGTAQVIQLDGNAVCRSEICRDHAWFIGFSPVENPEIAAAVIVEHGGFGAAAAAPIVGALLQRYHDIVHGTGAQQGEAGENRAGYVEERLRRGRGGGRRQMKFEAKKYTEGFNIPLAAVVGLLLIIGLVNLYSAVYNWGEGGASSLFWSQLTGP